MKRLNVKLALWLTGILLVTVVGVHFLHGYQLEWNADSLKRQAQAAVEQGNTEDAIKNYDQYLKYKDDPESYSALAKMVDTRAQAPGASNRDRRRAYTILEEAIRRHPELTDVRELLIEYMLMMARYDDGLGHISFLNSNGTTGPKLEMQRARCQLGNRNQAEAIKTLNALVGFDEQTRQFKADPGAGGHEVEAFQMLAQLLFRSPEGAQRANEVMDQLIVYNPGSAKAYLARAQFISATFRPDGSPESLEQAKQKIKLDLDKAIEIAPDDADVLMGVASFALNEKDYPRAKELLDKCLALHPKKQEVYLLLAQLALAEKNVEAGVEHLKRGLERAEVVQAILPTLFDLQLNARDLVGALQTCDTMEKRELYLPELVRFCRARVKVAELDFWEGSRELEAVRPALARSAYAGAYLTQLDLLLSGCYEALGVPDRQLEVARRVLQVSPAHATARLSEASALQRLGRFDEAVDGLQLLAANVEQFPSMRPQVLQLLMADQGRRPKDQRDWTAVNKLAELVYEDPARSKLNNDLLKAELLMAQDQLDEAQALLLACRKQDPKDQRVWMALTRLLQSKNRVDNIGTLLDQAEKEVGDVYALRQERLRQVIRQGGDDAPVRLKNLEQDLDKFSEDQRMALMTLLGGAYVQFQQTDDAKRCWKYAIEHDKKNAQIRQVLFELMSDTNDTAGMEAVLKDIHDSPNWGPQSPLYKYAKAMSLIRPLSAKDRGQSTELTEADRKSLTDARRLISEALSVRGEWGVLWRVRAEIDHFEGNVNGAIESYQRALACSQTGQAVVARRLVRLLSAQKRFAEADEALKYVGDIGSTDPLNAVLRQTMLAKGDIPKALELAEKDVAEDPTNPASQIGLAQVLEQAGRPEEAEAAYRKAVEVGPNLPQTWILLVRNLVANKKTPEATEVIRKATPVLESNVTALAQLHELVGDKPEAERYYQAAVDANRSDVAPLRQLAEFYFRQARSGEPKDFLEGVRQANPYLQRIVDATSNTQDAQSSRELSWARRSQAEVIAATGVYEDVVRATQLVEQNARDGKLAPEDIQAIVQMLSKRPEPASRAKSARLIEQLAAQRALSSREQLVLGQLYEVQGNWTRAKELMVSSLTQQGNDPQAMLAFVQALTKHAEYDEAARWLTTLDDVMSKVDPRTGNALKPAIYELRARVLAKTGQAEEAVAVLRQLVPRPLPPSELRRLAEVAMLMEQLGQYDAAQQLLEEYVSQEKRGTIAMAAFLGRRGQVDKAFELLGEARKNQSAADVLPVALETLRYNPDQATGERFKVLEGWASAGLQNEADVPRIKLLMAEIKDLQGQYDDVVKLYREVLAAKETTPAQAALVKNNLAFVLAVTKQNLPEALKLIDESINVMGPMSDLLDTRGLIYLNQGNLKQAMTDLRLSASDSPTVSKYLHLAQAEKQADNLDGARDALAQAEELGDNLSRLTPLERQSYQQLVDELK
ncbi:MAG: tetratricopeptide repeat protein [Pirellulales bacterium]